MAAYAPQAAVIAPLRVDAKTNEHKAALRLLGILPPLVGTVVTADAMFTHADVCAAVLERQGEYVLYAQDEPQHLEDVVVADRWPAADGADGPIGWQVVSGQIKECLGHPSKGHDRRTLRGATTCQPSSHVPAQGFGRAS